MKKIILGFVSFLIIFIVVVSMIYINKMNSERVDMDIKEINVQELDTYVTEGNVTSLVTNRYSDWTINRIYKLRLSTDELNRKYPVECLRRRDADNLTLDGEILTFYTSIYMGKTRYLAIRFDSNGNYNGSAKFRIFGLKSDFESFKIGQTTWKEIYKFDKNAYYSRHDYSASHVLPDFSTHYTTDGYMVNISYDSEQYISEITIEENWSL